MGLFGEIMGTRLVERLPCLVASTNMAVVLTTQ